MVARVDRQTNQANNAGTARPRTADPVPNWRSHITSRPGTRESPGGIGSTNHAGLDVGVPAGTPIQAAKDGKVVSAGNAGGYGNMVVIQHSDGTFTKYAHQSEINVQAGQEVKAGDVIGKVGSTGNSTGPHLHFEVRKGDPNAGEVLDPVAYLDGAQQVAAVDPGPGKSYAGGSPSSAPSASSPSASSSASSSVAGNTGSPSSMGLPASSAPPAASDPGASTAAPPGGTSVPAGNFQALLDKLKAMGIDEAYLKQLAEKYGVPVEMMLAVMMQESGGNPNAKSGAGAMGLMQLMPGTAEGLGVKNPMDPKQNLEGGAKYLGQMMKMFGGDKTKALAAYNAGPGNVQKHGGVPPFAETQKYVANITASMDNAASAFA